MEKGFLDKVEDNAAVRTWSKTTHVTQNNLQELKEIWDQWNDEVRQLFYNNYGDLPYLLDVKVDLVPTIEEYVALLRCSKFQVDKVYSRAINVATFSKKLINIIGMIVFPKALGHVDETVTDLFNRLDKRVTPIPVILAETFRSLSACRKAGEGRFIGCAQLLLAWFHSHFWKVDKVSYWVFSESYSPLKEIVATPRRDDISKEKWMAILQNLQEEDIEWRALWLLLDEILYRDDGYRKKIPEISSAWKQTRRMKRLAVGPMTTLEYNEWWVRRINDNTPKSNLENSQSIEEYLWVVPSELKIIRQDFEKRNVELEKKIEQMEEEKMNLRLDIDVQKLETEKLRKEKNKAEEELDSLKTDYKKLRLSMKTAGLGKTSEHKALEKSLSESQKEKGELKDRVAELERSLHRVLRGN
ncbi:hypothetical protein Gotur_028642 [Gossypium turneri]